jgi:aubergine
LTFSSLSIADDNTRTYSKALDDAANVNPQLIMCIVSNENSDRYSVIKKKCCLERAIPTQVMVIRTITPKFGKDAGSLLTVVTKVVIQMNSKLGGAPWMVDIPPTSLMVIGFDVFHDTINKQKSYGAMVATMDMKLKQNYFSAVSAHETGNELSNNFALNIVKAVNAFVRQHGVAPKKILIYRDGVGEGQTDYVYEHEIKEILAALQGAYNGAPVNMTFVVVSKRINTRFFKDPNNPQNPSPGTVVDDGVTLPER